MIAENPAKEMGAGRAIRAEGESEGRQSVCASREWAYHISCGVSPVPAAGTLLPVAAALPRGGRARQHAARAGRVPVQELQYFAEADADLVAIEGVGAFPRLKSLGVFGGLARTAR
jgi:hypothetical protein